MPLWWSRMLPTLLVLSLGAVSESAAQWSITAEVVAARFWGGSRETTGDRSFRPYRPTLVGVGIERSWGRAAIEVRGYHGNPSLALEGTDAVVVVKNALEVTGVAAELSIGIGTMGKSVRLMVSAGPRVEAWHLAGGSSHTTPGLSASLGAQGELGGRWSGMIRAGAAVTASPFSNKDLEAGFRPTALWRREVSGRLRFRL